MIKISPVPPSLPPIVGAADGSTDDGGGSHPSSEASPGRDEVGAGQEKFCVAVSLGLGVGQDTCQHTENENETNVGQPHLLFSLPALHCRTLENFREDDIAMQ